MSSQSRVRRIIGFACVGFCTSLLSSAALAEEGARTRNCPAGTPRDPQGYCRFSAPASEPTKQPRTPRRTQPQRSPDTRDQGASTPTPRPAATVTPRYTPPPVSPPRPALAPVTPSCPAGMRWDPSIGSCASLQVSAPTAYEAQPALGEPVAAQQPRSSTSPLLAPWLVLGAGLAVAATGGILYGLAYAEYGNHEQFSSLQDLDDWASSVRGRAIAGDVLVAVGAATAVAGLVWLLLRRRSFRASSRSSSVYSFAAAPSSSGGVMVEIGRNF